MFTFKAVVGIKWEQTHKMSFINWGFHTDFHVSWFLNYEKILIVSLKVQSYRKCDKESYTEMHLYVFTVLCFLSLLQYWSWGMPPWQTKWKNIRSVFPTSWISVWREQAMWTYVWSWITSVSLFGEKNYVLLFENYHKVVVCLHFKMCIYSLGQCAEYILKIFKD